MSLAIRDYGLLSVAPDYGGCSNARNICESAPRCERHINRVRISPNVFDSVLCKAAFPPARATQQDVSGAKAQLQKYSSLFPKGKNVLDAK